VRPLAALDLRQVRLANRLPRLGLDALHQLLLRERAIEPAQRTFHLAQIANFFRPASYIADRDKNIAIWNIVKNCIYACFHDLEIRALAIV